MRIFQLQGFDLAQGRHVARLRLCHEDEIPSGGLLRSALWSQAEEGRHDLVGALAQLENRRVLLALAGVPDDSRVVWTMQDVGGAGSTDLVALVKRRSGGSELLLLNCTGGTTSPARLREQVAQAVRAALSALAKIAIADRPSWTKLVVLCGWRRGVPVPTEASPLPALQQGPSFLEQVPEPHVWGCVPFVGSHRKDEIFIAFGRWSEFAEEPWIRLRPELVPLPWQSWEATPAEGFGDGAMVELSQHKGRVRVSLRLRASAHKASMKQDRHGNRVVKRVRALRAACYAGHLSVGAGRFVGESIEGGVPRLHWDWAEGQAPSAEAARSALTQAISSHRKLDPKTLGPPPAAERPDEP